MIQMVQNETIRAVFGRQRQDNGHYVPTQPLYTTYDWLRIDKQLGPYHDQLLLNSVTRTGHPQIFMNVIRDARERRHDHNTRASQSQQLARNNDNQPRGKRRHTFVSRAMTGFNEILANRITTPATFKDIVKTQIRQ